MYLNERSGYIWNNVPHMEKCIFIGYPPNYKGWKFYNPVTKKSVISECAQFDECHFLGIKGSTPTIIPTSLLEDPPTPSQQPSIPLDAPPPDSSPCSSLTIILS